ncbi:hypothetical protein GCM10023093_02540 [Nemorincola caseinilytica]|uniref:DUF4349 domain-containing protein n=1 Tax=Nemorincola caseinilytica TaxID=2054315 RepID=A0ABP8N2N1_9BACT
MPSSKLLWLLPLVVLCSCGNEQIGSELRANSTPATETIADTSIGSEAEAFPPDERKLVRTADIECRVPDVLAAVTRLEKCVRAIGGSVEESRISNNAEPVKMVAYKKDSLKEVRVCNTTAELRLRVPSAMLDSVMGVIPAGALYVEDRRLTQTDVTGKYMENELLNRPGDLHSTTKALQLAQDVTDAINVQRYADERKEQIVRRHIENQNLLRNVEYSTIVVRYSQPSVVYAQAVADAQYAAAVPYSAQLDTALRNGTALFRFLLLALVTIWPILLIAAIAMGIVVYTRRHRRIPVRQ